MSVISLPKNLFGVWETKEVGFQLSVTACSVSISATELHPKSWITVQRYCTYPVC